jgi:hypothetical protein
MLSYTGLRWSHRQICDFRQKDFRSLLARSRFDNREEDSGRALSQGILRARACRIPGDGQASIETMEAGRFRGGSLSHLALREAIRAAPDRSGEIPRGPYRCVSASGPSFGFHTKPMRSWRSGSYSDRLITLGLAQSALCLVVTLAYEGK